MSKKSGKVVKETLVKQLLRQLALYRKKNKISPMLISAATGIPKEKIQKSEYTLRVTWSEIAELLRYHRKWFAVKMIDDEECSSDPDALEEDPD